MHGSSKIDTQKKKTNWKSFPYNASVLILYCLLFCCRFTWNRFALSESLRTCLSHLMAKHLDINTRAQIVTLKEQSCSHSKVAKQLNVSRVTAQKNFQPLQVHRKLVGCSKHRQTPRNHAQNRHENRLLSETDRGKTAVDIRWEINNRFDLTISDSMVECWLLAAGLNGGIARKKPLVNRTNQGKWLRFARDHQKLMTEQWARVLFSDESKFKMYSSDCKIYISCRSSEEFYPWCTAGTVKGRGGSVMVWSWPYCENQWHWNHPQLHGRPGDPFKGLCWQEPASELDFPTWYAPIHTSWHTKNWFDHEKMTVLDWPPTSPNLNSIENLWVDINKAFKTQRPANLNDLWTTIEAALKNITMDRSQKLIESMSRRCAAVISNKGYATKYSAYGSN